MSLTFHIGAINVTDGPWFFRTYSFSISGRESAFRDGVRERDRKCMVSGRGGLLASSGVWAQLEAAHVFPLECENLWNEFGYSRWVTNMNEITGISKINSVQNGLLMKRDLHSVFDQYLFSINPDVCTLGGPPYVLGILTRYRTVIRLFLLPRMRTESMGAFLNRPAGILQTLIVSQMRFCAGTSVRVCWQTCVAVGSQSLRQTSPLALTRSKHCPVNRMVRSVLRWRWTCVCGTWLEMNR